VLPRICVLVMLLVYVLRVYGVSGLSGVTGCVIVDHHVVVDVGGGVVGFNVNGVGILGTGVVCIVDG